VRFTACLAITREDLARLQRSTADVSSCKLQALVLLRLKRKSLLGFESSVVCERSGQRFLRAKEAVLGFV
jgi:hypothetical protein